MTTKPIHHFRVSDIVSHDPSNGERKTVGLVTEMNLSTNGTVSAKAGADSIWDPLDPTCTTLVKRSNFEFVPELGDIIKRTDSTTVSVGVITRVKLDRNTSTIFAYDVNGTCLYDSDMPDISVLIENPFGKQFLKEYR